MKTKRDFIREITTNEANFRYCAETGVINGTLLVDIENAMQKYADQQCDIQRVSKSLPINECERCKNLATHKANLLEENYNLKKRLIGCPMFLTMRF